MAAEEVKGRRTPGGRTRFRPDAPWGSRYFHAYPASQDAYVYGPICVAESERAHGLATALFAVLRERLPRRECVAFVRRDNAASLRAHLKMGMKDVASFEHDGVAHAVLASAAPPDGRAR